MVLRTLFEPVYVARLRIEINSCKVEVDSDES